MASISKSNNFEKSLADLENIVVQLEQGDLSLDAAMAAFEQGVHLTRACQQQLDAAELKVRTLLAENTPNQSED
ncbi:exodeoxyribonuclease VII small subunit [Salinispirillum marinum]|uniref:Exodeoxyribonuclease 7 small subunit n=2 Tax=Saccharospirillaceae TaxID=255527 RepID=A0ABV8BHR1_9GAMM